jgi:hypothetical protein
MIRGKRNQRTPTGYNTKEIKTKRKKKVNKNIKIRIESKMLTHEIKARGQSGQKQNKNGIYDPGLS